MSKLLEVIKASCLWAARPEERLACAFRNADLLDRLTLVFPDLGGWRFLGKPMPSVTPDAIATLLYQNRDDSTERRPIESFGWYAKFSREHDTSDRRLRIDSRCGGWSVNLNGVHITTGREAWNDCATMRAILVALVESFEPDYGHVYSGWALQRNSELKLPFPVVDWMVYIAETRIPPDELPMVHAVEHVGSGTLVILKSERLHLDRPEDLALVEAVEPVIRRYQKPPLPKETHHPLHDAAKH